VYFLWYLKNLAQEGNLLKFGFEEYLVAKMNSLVSIVGVVLIGKENYPEWSRTIEHTLIFNDLWDDICHGDTKPTTDKELSI
jgi:hypothetical protein